jgi:hypothetical protein
MAESTVKAMWQRYAIALPANAPPTQRRETERAFYAGVYALLARIASERNFSGLRDTLLAARDEAHGRLTDFCAEDLRREAHDEAGSTSGRMA